MLSVLKQTYVLMKVKYGKFAPAAFFIGGVLFDVVTLGRVDQVGTLLQEFIFLTIAGFILFLEIKGGLSRESRKWMIFIWDYHIEIIHFLFGGLLSAFTIFYFKSTSSVSSILFIALLASFLVLNEIEYFKKKGVILRWAMFSVCLWSFMNILIPVLSGRIGLSVFILSSSIVMIPLFLIIRFVDFEDGGLRRKLTAIGAGVPLLGILLYFLEVIPPVPLSMQYAGIYHGVVKKNGQYILSRNREWWKFWQNGDQDFYYRTGDKVFLFARIFSPTDFSHQIKLRWLFKNSRKKWEVWDVIPIRIKGGREEGFRGFAFKSNVAIGDWRIVIETSDNREIGSIDFEILSDSGDGPRSFTEDIH